MSTDWRALCEELADGLASTGEAASGTYKALLDSARAALAAEPVADEAMPPRVGHILRLAEIIREVDGNHDKGAAALAEAILSHPRVRSAGLAAEAVVASAGPTDEELLELWQGWNLGWDPQKGMVLMPHPAEYARAVLARYGHQPAPPADGEVAESVAELRRICLDVAPCDAATITRAAALLEQRHPTPVPVSERLPGPEDCDEEGRCWMHGKVEGDWRLISVINPGIPKLGYCFSHWLPFHALPLPEQPTPTP